MVREVRFDAPERRGALACAGFAFMPKRLRKTPCALSLDDVNAPIVISFREPAFRTETLRLDRRREWARFPLIRDNRIGRPIDARRFKALCVEDCFRGYLFPRASPANHSFNFDQRCRPATLRTAIAMAFF